MAAIIQWVEVGQTSVERGEKAMTLRALKQIMEISSVADAELMQLQDDMGLSKEILSLFSTPLPVLPY